MAFNSLHFLVFFPVVLVLYFTCRPRLRWSVLLGASFYFYMAWQPEYGLLLASTILIGWGGGLLLLRCTGTIVRRTVFAACLCVILSALFFFKYFNFVAENLYGLRQWMTGNPGSYEPWEVLLPIGISFYTFQIVSYLIDVADGRLQPERHPGYFALYVSFFPQLVAGPIERASHLLPQLRNPRAYSEERLFSGLRLMGWGFFKKVVVADHLALFVNAVFEAPHEQPPAMLVMGTVFFAFQVYCDFSAYSDIAIGAAQTLGIDLMKNFRQPYFATSIGDFWKRWHISLSTWLTDYVFSAFSRARWLRMPWYPKFLAAIILTFLVSGIWHGAAWTFIVWGLLHGVYLVLSALTKRWRQSWLARTGLASHAGLLNAWRITFTFLLVCVGYVFFRAQSVADACFMLYTIATWTSPATIGAWSLVQSHTAEFLVCCLGIAIVVGYDAWQHFGSPEIVWNRLPDWSQATGYVVGCTCIVLLGAFYGHEHAFIYFQF